MTDTSDEKAVLDALESITEEDTDFTKDYPADEAEVEEKPESETVTEPEKPKEPVVESDEKSEEGGAEEQPKTSDFDIIKGNFERFGLDKNAAIEGDIMKMPMALRDSIKYAGTLEQDNAKLLRENESLRNLSPAQESQPKIDDQALVEMAERNPREAFSLMAKESGFVPGSEVKELKDQLMGVASRQIQTEMDSFGKTKPDWTRYKSQVISIIENHPGIAESGVTGAFEMAYKMARADDIPYLVEQAQAKSVSSTTEAEKKTASTESGSRKSQNTGYSAKELEDMDADEYVEKTGLKYGN